MHSLQLNYEESKLQSKNEDRLKRTFTIQNESCKVIER